MWYSTTDPERRLVDDPFVSELTEPVNDHFVDAWDWAYRRDGGVIGELAGGAWVNRIDPRAYGGVDPPTALRAYDRSGTSIPLSLATDPGMDIWLSPIYPPPGPAVPALSPLAIGMLGAALAPSGARWTARMAPARTGLRRGGRARPLPTRSTPGSSRLLRR